MEWIRNKDGIISLQKMIDRSKQNKNVTFKWKEKIKTNWINVVLALK